MLAVLLFSGAGAEARELPDLVVAKADLKATGVCAAGKVAVAGRVRVRNAGKGRGQIFTTRDMLRAYAPAVPGLVGAVKFVNSMRPGDEQAVELRLRATSRLTVAGPVAVVITVDPRNVFPEANEKNNAKTVQVLLDCR